MIGSIYQLGESIEQLGESIDDWDYISTIGSKYR